MSRHRRIRFAGLHQLVNRPPAVRQPPSYSGPVPWRLPRRNASDVSANRGRGAVGDTQITAADGDVNAFQDGSSAGRFRVDTAIRPFRAKVPPHVHRANAGTAIIRRHRSGMRLLWRLPYAATGLRLGPRTGVPVREQTEPLPLRGRLRLLKLALVLLHAPGACCGPLFATGDDRALEIVDDGQADGTLSITPCPCCDTPY
jgi:hypothetical protein